MINTWTPLKSTENTFSKSLESQIEIEYSKEMLEYFQEESKRIGVTLREVYEEDLACKERAYKVMATLKPFNPIEDLWKLESFKENVKMDENLF